MFFIHVRKAEENSGSIQCFGFISYWRTDGKQKEWLQASSRMRVEKWNKQNCRLLVAFSNYTPLSFSYPRSVYWQLRVFTIIHKWIQIISIPVFFLTCNKWEGRHWDQDWGQFIVLLPKFELGSFFCSELLAKKQKHLSLQPKLIKLCLWFVFFLLTFWSLLIQKWVAHLDSVGL